MKSARLILQQPRAERLYSIDALRGIAMVLMALDHVRDYFGEQLNPMDIANTTTALFFTRWITHFCASLDRSDGHRLRFGSGDEA